MRPHKTLDPVTDKFLKSHSLSRRQRRPVKRLHKSEPQTALSELVDHYKDLELRFFVTRQAISKSQTENEDLSREEDNIADEQEKLLQTACETEICDMQDVLNCFMLWHGEVVKVKRSSELTPADKMMRRVFLFLKNSYGEKTG